MTLGAGLRIGPYEISSLIGAGGMGEVYKARDTRLGREVAIKVLPTAVAADPARLRRFEQEARAAGMLNHPNILAIYDIGVHEGNPYVVSELLEGETLRERMASGKIAQRRAVEFALQTAHGLAAAHRKGITHRDLKPENLFVTRDGPVKILDFGLAKLTQPNSYPEGDVNALTLSMATDPGLVMGSVGYMSPEQVRGQTVDHRSDIFSLGVVLYEMLSGSRAFPGQSAADIMSATLKDDPADLTALDPKLAPGLARIVHHCLEKRPEDRFESARDLAFALDTLSSVSNPTMAMTAIETKPAPARRLLPVFAATAILAVVGGAVLADRWLHPFSLPDFQQLTFRRGPVYGARFGPDGQSVFYSAEWEGNPQEVYATHIGSPESRVFGVSNAQLLAVSSSGELALLMRPSPGAGNRTIGTLARVPPAGGPPRELLERVTSADWSPDGAQLAVIHSTDAGSRLEFPIGHPLLTKAVGGFDQVRFSPKGDLIAFVDYMRGAIETGTVTIVDLSGKTRPLGHWNSVSGLAWGQGGNEIFVAAGDRANNNAIYALSLAGRRRLVWRTSGILTLQDISRDGLAMVTQENVRRAVVGLTPGSTRERDLSWLDDSVPVAISADGSYLLLGGNGEGGKVQGSVYWRKSDGSPAVRLGEGFPMSLSPDGKWVLGFDRVPPPPRPFLLPTGAGERKALQAGKIAYTGGVTAWFPDSKRFVLNGRELPGPLRCYIADIDSLTPRALTPETKSCRVISPDARTILTMDTQQKLELFSMETGEFHPVPPTPPGLIPLNWTSNPDVILLGNGGSVYKFNVKTGHAELWKDLSPGDPAGVIGLGSFIATPDGRYYAYGYVRWLGDLFLIRGLK